MEVSETVVNLNEIEKDLKAGLINAEINSNETSGIASDTAIPKSALNLGAPIVKVFCKIKNGVQFRLVTKNLSEDVKKRLQHFGEVKDQEVVLYKSALDQYGTEYLTPELVEMINKYANSPLAPLIEFELEKFQLMQTEVKLIMQEKKEE